MNQESIIRTINGIANHAREEGIAHLSTNDKKLLGNYIQLGEDRCVNFGSCSYLGLEFHPSIRSAAKKAIDDYGTQFSCSRAYVSPRYYKELEQLLNEIFDGYTIVTPTTTLGHMAAIPTVVSSNDLIILDHQVHNSVQTAANIMKSKGTQIELVRHNRMDLLEDKIKLNRSKYNKIWYMADGIYSMYGDTTPLDDVYKLLDKYNNFHFYVDDAHGMSCFGDKGQGFVLSEKKIHNKMIVATSFAKAFATGGGALIFPNQSLAQKVKNCGGPMITSGPMQPAALAGAIASAKLHLSNKFKQLQDDLYQNILFTNMMLKRYNLPNLSEEKSPIFFIAASVPKIAQRIIQKLKKEGFYLNIGVFPAVPIKNTGIRFTITRLHTFQQIEQMVKAMAELYDNTLDEFELSRNDIYKAFKLKPELQPFHSEKINNYKSNYLEIQHFQSIDQIEQELWDKYVGFNGTSNWTTLKTFEETFSSKKEDSHQWKFDYFLVYNARHELELATFTTASIVKDDMTMPAQVSKDIELMRQSNPNYMTSKSMTLGCPLSVGNHLYLNRSGNNWKRAINLLLSKLTELQGVYETSSVILRDLPIEDSEMHKVMFDNGYFKSDLPVRYDIEKLEWNNENEFFAQLSKNGKRHYRKNITKNEKNFDVDICQNPDLKTLSQFYDLYTNVKNKSFEINTFQLPFELFQNLAGKKDWEFISLKLKDHMDARNEKAPLCMALCHKGISAYNFLLVGINYDFNYKFGSYRQMLAKIIFRAKELNYNKISLGYTTGIEKKRFGAREIPSCAYMQINDNYELEALAAMSTTKTTEDGINKSRVLSI